MALAREIMQAGLSGQSARQIQGVAATAVSAAGTTLATATALTVSHNNVTTVAASSGVALPAADIMDEVFVYNGTVTNQLTVYPNTSSETINQLSAGTGMKLAPYTGCMFRKASSTAWIGFLSA